MTKRDRQSAGGALGLLEEAVGILRRSRAGTLGCYYIGTLPFVLVLLYFLTDMTQSAFASESLIGDAGIMAAVFIWMKCWHAVFAGRLMEQLCGEAPRPWPLRRICRVISMQAAVQPWGLILLPLAAMAVLPLPWIYAFFQNACVYGDGRTDRPGTTPLSSAWHQARGWPKQSIVGMLILLLFGLFVMINIGAAVIMIPDLAKTFLDIDTPFSRGGGGFSVLLNTTFLGIVLSLGYLCLDPLVKAFYALRCFYGQSLRTGQDLRSEFRSLISVGCLVICFVLAVSTGAARAEENPPPNPQSSQQSDLRAARGAISARDLDDSLDDVLARRKYAWRIPRPQEAEDLDKEKSFIASATEKVWGWVSSAGEWGWDKAKKIWKFIFPTSDRGRDAGELGDGSSGGFGWVGLLRYLVYAALVGIAVLLIVVFVKRLKISRIAEANTSVVELPPVDLEDENVTADDLPESGWLALARRLMEEGDSRLALRAMYLASLAMLAGKSRISIAKFKSNMDYQRELDRRCHSMPQLLDAFGRNVGVFEAVWYGTHEASAQIIDAFTANQTTIGQIIADA